MEDDLLERRWQENPESKLELIDGRLIVGNSLAGSRYLLREILTGWGPAAAMPFAPEPLWWRALTVAFADHQPPSADAPLAAWEEWATATVHASTGGTQGRSPAPRCPESPEVRALRAHQGRRSRSEPGTGLRHAPRGERVDSGCPGRLATSSRIP